MRAVPPDAGLEPHQHRMPPAVRVEHLLARQRDLHRPAGHQGRLGRHDLVVEGIALAAEAAAVGRRDHPDAVRRQVERARHLPVQVVRRLRGRPQRQPPVGIQGRDARVLLEREMGVALVEEQVLEDPVGGRERGLHLAEGQVREAVHVGAFPVVVNAGLRPSQGLLGRGDGGERLVRHTDQLSGVGRRPLAGRDHRGDRIAHVADLVSAQGVLVLAHRHDPVGDGKIGAAENGHHAGGPPGLHDVHGADPRMRMRRAKQLPEEHARQRKVVREPGLPGDLGAGVHPAAGLADDLHAPASDRPCGGAPARAGPGASARAAASTASKICR